jgi:hypothetical protein
MTQVLDALSALSISPRYGDADTIPISDISQFNCLGKQDQDHVHL